MCSRRCVVLCLCKCRYVTVCAQVDDPFDLCAERMRLLHDKFKYDQQLAKVLRQQQKRVSKRVDEPVEYKPIATWLAVSCWQGHAILILDGHSGQVHNCFSAQRLLLSVRSNYFVELVVG
jgi:hypothetical protein